MLLKDLSTLVKDFYNGSSKWDKGVLEYAIDLVSNPDLSPVEEFTSINNLKTFLLQGASNWKQFSNDGYSFIHNQDIAERLCTQSELKALTQENGIVKDTIKNEDWLSLQAEALEEAWNIISEIFKNNK